MEKGEHPELSYQELCEWAVGEMEDLFSDRYRPLIAVVFYYPFNNLLLLFSVHVHRITEIIMEIMKLSVKDTICIGNQNNNNH